MNPASYGHHVQDADSTISYSSSENWYKRRVKQSKSSNRSSAHNHSNRGGTPDDAFIDSLLSKNKFSSHLKLDSPNNVEVVQEPESLVKLHNKTISLGDDEFVEEIIESDDEQRYPKLNLKVSILSYVYFLIANLSI